MIQGNGGGIRAPAVTVEGGVLVVDVATNDSEVAVSESGVGVVTTYPVGPDKKARIPVAWQGGALLYVSIGRWPNMHTILVEVISSFR